MIWLDCSFLSFNFRILILLMIKILSDGEEFFGKKKVILCYNELCLLIKYDRV